MVEVNFKMIVFVKKFSLVEKGVIRREKRVAFYGPVHFCND